MHRALAVLVFALLLAPGAHAQTEPLQAFGSADSLAAFGARLVAWQARLDAEAQREREQWRREAEAQREACTAASPTVTVAPGAIVPAPGRVVVVAGMVVDGGRGEALIGATVRLSETVGAATAVDGAFRFVVDSATAKGSVLVAAFIGYEQRAVPISLSPGDSLFVQIPLCSAFGGLGESVALQAGIVSTDASVTNTQHAGVDEGGIVKLHGDHLVILRRGRLFTVDVSGRSLRPVDAVDAYGPGLGDAWYDEMLVVRETVVVIGYSYSRGGTEIGLFSIDDRGRLRHRNTYHLRSNDYYSSRNYTARLVGGRLVFYTPLVVPVRAWASGLDAVLPAMRRWTGRAEAPFEPIATATRVYRPARDLASPNAALHTVTSCAIDRGALDCEATAVVGAFGHTFYTSPTAVYVWLSGWSGSGTEAPGVVYRMPFDGSAPRALGVAGSPTDQLSFLEADDHLQVLVNASGRGQWMWNAEGTSGALALLRVPLGLFGDGREDAPRALYRPLPRDGGWRLANRFVGGRLIYGGERVYRRPNEARTPATAYVVDWQTGAVDSVHVPHDVERIDVLGQGAVVVGSGEDGLHLTALRLGAQAAVASAYVMPGAAQGESRSHGYFYRPTGDDHGLVGLPVRRAGESRYASLWNGSAAVLYLRDEALRLAPLGELVARPDANTDDHCQASCADWYGNARPLFIGDRVFALMGYEIVEGRVSRGRIREVRRTRFAPRPTAP